jgi:hypothetical protein
MKAYDGADMCSNCCNAFGADYGDSQIKLQKEP